MDRRIIDHRAVGLTDLDRKRNRCAHLGAVLPLLCSIILVACAPVEDTPSSASAYRLPWPNGNGEYSIQDVPLQTFHEPELLRGEAASIVLQPKVNGAGGPQSIQGEEPIARWIRQGSRMIPADFVTLQAATIYAHLEKLREIDIETGVFKKLKGPERVGLLVIVGSGGADVLLNNAFFDRRFDSLFFVPYTGPYLPISLNAGIIGHEHFHRIFNSHVLETLQIQALAEIPCMGAKAISPGEPAPSELQRFPRELPLGGSVPPEVFNAVLLRGINEGLADFWGWAYSGDEFFAGRSLGPADNKDRRLDTEIQSIPTLESVRNRLLTVGRDGRPILKSPNGLGAAAYQVGTDYARFLRTVAVVIQNSSGVDRMTAAKQVRLALAQSFESLANEMNAKIRRTELAPELLIKPALERLIKMSASGPAAIDSKTSVAVCGELLRLNASAELKSGLCGDEIRPLAVTGGIAP